MTCEFIPVRDADVSRLAELAHEIWFDYWPDLIGIEQTAYMVENFQSENAIRRDMTDHSYEYWFIVDEDGRTVGYTGGYVEPETNRFFISKIYLQADERGKGYASATIRFYVALCACRGLDAMYLTVNKHNELGIRAYKAKDFKTIDSVETQIGDGFIMDDYIMEKKVE